VTKTRRAALIFALALAVPRAALACPVCFGQNNSPLAAAMNQGILLMLVVVVAVLACFAAFFINLLRRAMRAEQMNATREPDAAGTRLVGPQEGTV
jgi:hypothetical protein